MAITFFGSASIPADNASQNGSTLPVVLAPPGSMLADDYVMVLWHGWRNPALTSISVSQAGGQTWTTEAFQVDNPSFFSARLFHCRFNGTWSANPSWTANTTTADSFGGVMLVFRGVDTTTALDVALTQGTFAQAQDITITGVTTNTAGAMVVALWISANNNQWALQTGGWSQDVTQYRNTPLSSASTSYGYKIVDATTSGDVTNRQTPDNRAGYRYILALKAAAAGGITPVIGAATLAGVASRMNLGMTPRSMVKIA